MTGHDSFTVLGRYAFRWSQHELVELIDLTTGERRELLLPRRAPGGQTRRPSCHWNGYAPLGLHRRRAQPVTLSGFCP